TIRMWLARSVTMRPLLRLRPPVQQGKLPASLAVDHAGEHAAIGLLAAAAGARHGPADADELRREELGMKFPALRREVEKALPAVAFSLALDDVAPLDELAQHTSERLLGDLQDRQEFRNAHARITSDEMNDPVVGASET